MKKVVKTRAFKDRLRGHKDGVLTLYSPDGPASGILYSASKDGCVRAWDLIERKITIKLHVSRIPNETHQEEQNANDGLKDENQDDQDDQKEERKKFDDYEKNLNFDKKLIGDQLNAATFSQNSIYGGFGDGLIFAWNLKSGEIIHVYEGHLDKITQLCFLNPRQMISSSMDHTIRVWDTFTGQNEYLYKLPGPINYMRIKGDKIQCIVSKNTFYQLDPQKGTIEKCIKFQGTSITCFITWKEFLYIGTINETMEIYDIENLPELTEQNQQLSINPLKIINGLNGWLLCMNILDDFLYTGGDDRKIKVWDLKKNTLNVEEFNGHEDGVVNLEFAGSMIYSGSFDHSIRSWDLKEMHDRIRERSIMFKEDLWSKKYDAYYMKLYGKKKKKKKGGKK